MSAKHLFLPDAPSVFLLGRPNLFSPVLFLDNKLIFCTLTNHFWYFAACKLAGT